MKINGSVIEIGSEEIRRVVKAYSEEQNPIQRAAIWARDMRGRLDNEWQGMIQAANSLGSVSGDIVVQRSLDLLKSEYPLLTRISTNFSADAAQFGTQVFTRLRTVPVAGDYDAEVGYPTQDVGTPDVPITLDQHKSVQIKFNANELSTTQRQLFPEQEEGLHAGLSKAVVDALFALVTPENFPHQSAFPLDDFNRRSVIKMKSAMRGRKVSNGVFTLLLSPDFHGELEADSTIVSHLINKQAGDAIATSELPPVAKFQPFEADYLPNGLNGFGFRTDALAMASRAPGDYSTVFPGLIQSGGMVSTVVQPETGLSVALAKFVDHRLGAAFMRVALMFGVEKGNPECGQRLV